MASLDRNLRRDLENAVKKARRAAEAGARQAVEQLAVGHHEPWSALSPDQRKLRNRLRAHGRQLGDKLDEKKGTQTIDRLTGECAYEHWHRLLFARFLAENDLLVEPQSSMALSLDECRELAREQSKDWLVLASEFAQRMLPQIFRAGDPVLEVALPPEKRQELEALLEGLPREVFIADDSLGWVYQFWQADQKDAVNASENKIGADELPAVTQLFTEDYMVLFLLHNTLGAWWAGKVLVAKPDLARSAASEDELRAACAVQGGEWSYLRFVREGDVWRPAAGTFPGWPATAKDLTVLDPCMGSGHFLAFALPMLVALRREEEKLSVAEAVDAVLRDNLFGLELDPRCTQIAAFNVGLTAWKLAGYRPLPGLNLACAGLGINAPVSAWTALAAGDALAENAMKQLYELFRQAPTLGSLIDPTRVGGELFVANFDKIRGLLSSALASEESESAELAVVAQGVAKAASILAHRYTLVATNVPYLKRGKQAQPLQEHSDKFHDDAKGNLACTFVDRCLRIAAPGGSIAVVSINEMLFLGTYKHLRKRLLRDYEWAVAARLGAGAFETISGEVVNVSLLGITANKPNEHRFLGFDLSDDDSPPKKAASLLAREAKVFDQNAQLKNPDARVVVGSLEQSARLLSEFATPGKGSTTGDSPHYHRCFWELPKLSSSMTPWLDSPLEGDLWSGRQLVSLVSVEDQGLLAENGCMIRGQALWGKTGVAVSKMSGLRAFLYAGEVFDDNVGVLCPRDPELIPAILAYCTSEEYFADIRAIDQALKVTAATLAKVPFDVERWREVAETQFADGLPPTKSRNPTQWLFDGHPKEATAPLQVAVARLVGYRWPRQTGSTFPAAPALAADDLEGIADDDGIVCLTALRGEAPAADRVRALLAKAYGTGWSSETMTELLGGVGAPSLEDWLRSSFFSQHCELFEQRPFVWHIWDGLANGFAAFVNYHQLAAPNGEGRRTLEKLIYTYLGDWIDRQRADQKSGVEGADARVAAAEHLKQELERILEGEPPYDIFVRWKPLHLQPMGWDPDVEDGVRLNIRPFMTAKPLNARGKNACILRVAPKIKWEKDRGTEPAREHSDFPWFYGCEKSAADFTGGKHFDGVRWNDLHYTRSAKLAARERANGGKS
jgi:hypothetical protein